MARQNRGVGGAVIDPPRPPIIITTTTHPNTSFAVHAQFRFVLTALECDSLRIE